MQADVNAPRPSPRVLAIVVAHDGHRWLPASLDALAAQSYDALELLAVDNGSTDGSRELLLERLGEGHVLLADRDLGFGAAVSMALDARPSHEHTYVLLVHDDLALAPDAVEHLVAAMEADPRLAAVGPKLRGWDAPQQLQAVGATIDSTGRVEPGVDPGELDQGQHDEPRRSLYVSTAGMLLRRSVLEQVGRFDRRFHVFRDDLDLCWRLWNAGHDIEVVPAAVGRHVAAATDYLRLGQTRFIGPRYFAERNTLATLLKNYGMRRLALVVPLFFVVGIAKVIGFLLTRRVSDAWQTVRAWAWNLLHLRETWRLRRLAQQCRWRGDDEIAPLFARIGPRLRAYAEAMGTWIAGADHDPVPEPSYTIEASEPPSATRRLVGLVRRRPTLVAGAVLGVVVLVGGWPLLLPGELRGGELAPWPTSPAVFFDDYVAGWHTGGAFGTSAAPSPAQPLLGALQLLLGGSSYLAPRVLLFGSLLAAWVLSLRAAQAYSRRRLPRVVAATAYVLSPPALAALATGRVGALVVLAALPGILAGVVTFARRTTSPDRAWRAVAGVTLLAAVAGAFEPLALVAVVAVGLFLTLFGLAVSADPGWSRAIVARASVVVIGPVVLLLPWSLDLFAGQGRSATGLRVPAGGELWRWLLLAPDLAGFPGLWAGIGFFLAGLLGLTLASQRRPGVVAGLWAIALLGAAAAWWLDRVGSATWAGLPLLATAAAFAGLLALAFTSAEAQLTRHAFGWRQLATLVTAAGVSVSLAVVAVTLATGPWDAYALARPALPSFLTTSVAEDGPFRVLVLADEGEHVAWEVVPGSGPTMASYGVPLSPVAQTEVASAVDDVLTGRDPRAADRLGLMNIRHVVVPPGASSPSLDVALLAQAGLEPRPVADGRVYEVSEVLPRAGVVDLEVAEQVATRRALPDGAEVRELEQDADGGYSGEILSAGVSVLVAEPTDPGWRASTARGTVPPLGLPFLRFDVVGAGELEVTHVGDTTRTLAVTGQLLVLLLAVSLALRPPRFARTPPPASPPPPPAAGASGRIQERHRPEPEVVR